MNTLAERLKWAREAGELSARELSLLSGSSAAVVAQIERGDRGSRVSASMMVAVGAVLGVTVEWLVEGTGDKPTERRVRAAVARAKQTASAAEQG